MYRKGPKYKGKHLGIFECLDGGKVAAENRSPGEVWELVEHG